MLLSLALFSSLLHAAWYQAEVIVFQQRFPDVDGELWYENPGLPDRSNSIELISAMDEEDEPGEPDPGENEETDTTLKPREELIPYLQLPDEELQLEGVFRVLRLSREYRPLLHVAWQQPALGADRARPVHIQKFEDPPDKTEEDWSIDEPEDIESMLGEGRYQEDVYQVLDLIFDGTIRLRSSRFLHVDVDIAYFPEVQDADSGLDVIAETTDQPGADYVRLQESRKIRLNEIHYFDHPLFGVILRISRMKTN